MLYGSYRSFHRFTTGIRPLFFFLMIRPPPNSPLFPSTPLFRSLYRQERVGQAGRPFTLYKFRSMVSDAEADTGPVFAAPDDARRTAVGRLMRRFSLDELPQLINIIRGDMSLVGPRPERPFFVERFGSEIPRYLERHQVRPGVTGWAQVNDLRGSTSIADRTIYDIYYIENWSLSFDIKILLLTTGRIFLHAHAY